MSMTTLQQIATGPVSKYPIFPKIVEAENLKNDYAHSNVYDISAILSVVGHLTLFCRSHDNLYSWDN